MKNKARHPEKVNKPINPRFLKRMAGGIPILNTVTKPCKVNGVSQFTFEIVLTQEFLAI